MTSPRPGATSSPRARARMPLSVWIVAVALPLLVSAVAIAVQLAWLPQLPDPIAIHWGTDGVDGFGPVWTTTVLTAALAVGLTGMFAAFLATARGAAPTATHKLLAVISLSESIFVGIVVTASLGIQRGLDDASDAPDLGSWIPVALGVAAVAGVIAWFAMPKAVSAVPDAAPSEPLHLTPGERSVWLAEARLSGGATTVILLAVGVSVAVSVFAVVVSDWQLWPILFVPLLLLVLCAAGVAWHVRVEPSGLTVRARPLGWPRVRIPASDIARVDVSQVEPLAEFGGWGWRWAPGRSFGVISRGGEAIEVTRRDGRRFTVTVDDAATGASLLAAYAQVDSR